MSKSEEKKKKSPRHRVRETLRAKGKEKILEERGKKKL
jgi:hypothetical protein